MTDLERATLIIDKFPVEEEFDAKVCLIEEVAEAFADVREEERKRVIGLLEEWREAMESVGQLHSLEFMLSEVRRGNQPDKGDE